ncbi:glycerol-3-phosphate 1-O-acyltransferase PlsY [Lachnospiraceae bacterium CLA-AA-H215]|uniref:Glycerol-3-phosphate acyltransferase n=1 Tax=Hominifimenecus microfluidus TaxID=2885348 RepID=A0AAE3E9S1_9FIRM|nr:glycerol-3-phosphate 1-O-acyltransferase PlsY [Hominifimenecus microfluidus]MCC2230505.1 glycerol-3-phosphate 1-O-acyltransferase PlsY [Hominifimenecus microfluidus]
MVRVACLLIGYVCGLFQTAYIYGRINGIDIREYGSGNSGTTNALRVLGKKAGLIVFAGDILKILAAGFLVTVLFNQGDFFGDRAALYKLYAGLGAVLGHNFPFYLNFKGGKGIAVTSGLILMMDWRITILCLIAFALTVGLTRYVSLGSLVITALFMISWIFLGQTGRLALTPAHLLESYVLVFLIVAMAYWRHRANIKRLIAGTESKIGQKKE